MNRDRCVYIGTVIDCIERIEHYTAGYSFDDFSSDTKTQDAVIRNLEVMGQAIKDFGVEDLMADDPDTPWEKVAGFRNILAHEYLSISLSIVWEVVASHLSSLKGAAQAVSRHLDC